MQLAARDLAVIVLLVGLAGFAVAYFLVGPGRRRGPRPRGDIPLSMRPYHSDEELESTGLERAMAWGFALTLFMALFLPVYWLLEPQRINQKQEEFFYEADLERGRLEFAQACATCHGSDGSGGFAPHPNPDIDAPWPAPALNNIVARYADNPNVVDLRRFMTETIRQGRPGTPMPAWSTFYGGAMNDQQIESIIDYILAIQVDEVEEAEAMQGASGAEIFDANCARCHGPEGQSGQVDSYQYPGPPLTEVFARFGGGESARAAIRDTIENGRIVPAGADMPAWEGVLTDSAIRRVVDYLESIQEPQ